MGAAQHETTAVYDRRRAQLRRYMDKHRYNMEAMGVALACDPEYIRMMLTGKRNIGWRSAARINACLGLNLFRDE